MHFTAPVCLALIMVSHAIGGRIWTDTSGRTVDADIVNVHPNRTVTLKTASGSVVTVPFDTFSETDIEHLDHLISQLKRESLHVVPWQKMNEVFGLEIWQDEVLWDDPTEAVSARLGMESESKTDYMENHRTYPLGDEAFLGEPVYTTVLYGGPEFVESYSMVFINTGDSIEVYGRRRTPSAEQIEACGDRIQAQLQNLLGEPERDSLGRDILREKIWRWDWNGHAVMLSLQEGVYVALRIMPSERADNGGRNPAMSDEALKSRLAGCVVRRDNGDVVIDNIPMINQGPKGYCSPATWERYLRYLDISADMYLLALAANTKGTQGTYSPKMIKACRNIVSSNGRKLKEIDQKPTLDVVSDYIDQGLPVMWRMYSDPLFRKAIHENSAFRNDQEPEAKEFGRGGGGHICLIIGYNEQTGEFATSDSWGPEYSERWVKIPDALRVSRGNLSVIRW